MVVRRERRPPAVAAVASFRFAGARAEAQPEKSCMEILSSTRWLVS